MTSSRLHRVSRQAVPTQKLIVFHLRQEQFALPIQFAHRVVPMGQLFGTHEDAKTGLMLYQGKQLFILDIDRLVFSSSTARPAQLPAAADLDQPLPDSLPDSFKENRSWEAEQISANCVLILQDNQGNLTGIPLSQQPFLLRVPESAFVQVPPAYLAEGYIRCISALVVPKPDQPPLFLLNLNQLIQPQPERLLVSESL